MKTLLVNLTALSLMLFAIGCKKAEDPAASDTTIPEAGSMANQMEGTVGDTAKTDGTPVISPPVPGSASTFSESQTTRIVPA